VTDSGNGMTNWERRQEAFAHRLSAGGLSHLDRGTVVVLPSLSFPRSELAKITGVQHYEERMLFFTLFLRSPALHIVFVTSLTVDPAIVDYYLNFLPDPEDARRRLRLVALDDHDIGPLSQKMLRRPEILEQIRGLVPDHDEACVLPFNVTPPEKQVAEALELPLYGPTPDQVWLGSKSGSRRMAKRAGVAILEGREELRSLDALDIAIEVIRARAPHARAVVVKLNNGFSGQGNAIVELEERGAHFNDDHTTFCGAGESWSTFGRKVQEEGAIVEELVRRESMVSPSVQMRIDPGGNVEMISTHDQVLGGPDSQVYLGAKFPAHPSYRLTIQEDALKVGRVLAEEGVIGSFGVDFLVAAGVGGNHVYLSEINLRMGGTTHPFWMARLVTEGDYDEATGELVADGRPKCYVASDNVKYESLIGKNPEQVIDLVEQAGLGFDPATRTGATLHLLGAVHEFGKMGLTAIANSTEEAEDLYEQVLKTLSG
jgi:hypothetical protein